MLLCKDGNLYNNNKYATIFVFCGKRGGEKGYIYLSYSSVTLPPLSRKRQPPSGRGATHLPYLRGGVLCVRGSI